LKKGYFILIFLLLLQLFRAQTVTFRANEKWGIKENENVIIPPVYDTVFNYDATGKVCLACFKVKSTSANKFMKVMSTSFNCNYLNKKNEKLKIRNGRDTCSVFSLGKSSVKQYTENSPTFVASVKGKKHLVDKDFRQLTRRGYHDISTSGIPEFYVAQEESESEIIFTGLINTKEETVVPYQYSKITINPHDSIIIACSAGVRPNSDDDLYDYSGKKTASYRRHIELATKNYIIHKLYEPKEHYILYNIKSLEEKMLEAEEIAASTGNEILIRIKKDWYLYDLVTNTKKAARQTSQ
jgi:hypothetical protein